MKGCLFILAKGGCILAKQNYGSKKRQRELARQEKKERKKQRKMDRKADESEVQHDQTNKPIESLEIN